MSSLNKTLSFLKKLVNISNVFIKDTQYHMPEALTSNLFLKPNYSNKNEKNALRTLFIEKRIFQCLFMYNSIPLIRI